jgi:hypothetical protein
MTKQNKSITFRINSKLYDRCVERAIEISNNEKRIVKVSEIIRNTLKKEFKCL